MGIESLIVFLIIGAIAGWLAGLIVKGYGFGLIGNIVVGIIGAFIAGWLFPASVSLSARARRGNHPRDHRRGDPAVPDQPGEAGLAPSFHPWRTQWIQMSVARPSCRP